jgi:hypothetical protein
MTDAVAVPDGLESKIENRPDTPSVSVTSLFSYSCAIVSLAVAFGRLTA